MAAREDDFSQKTKDLLARRVAHHCSRPSCKAPTSGPSESGDSAVNIGKAAHITAARPGGPRFDATLSGAQRRSFDNGIWLCTKCADLVDKNCGADYPAPLLKHWKQCAEEAARRGMNAPHKFTSGEANAHVIGTVIRYKSPSLCFEIRRRAVPAGMKWYEPISLQPLNPDPERTEADLRHGIILDATFGTSDRACAFELALQNTGTAVEPFAAINMRIAGANIWKQDPQSADRMHLIGRPDVRSSVAGFSVSNLAPREHFSLKVLSHEPGPFDAETFSSVFSAPTVPLIFDAEFGEPKLVPEPNWDPKFLRCQYPFE